MWDSHLLHLMHSRDTVFWDQTFLCSCWARRQKFYTVNLFFIYLVWGNFPVILLSWVKIENLLILIATWVTQNVVNTGLCVSPFFLTEPARKDGKGFFFPFLFCISFLLELETSMKIFLAVFFLPIQSSLLFTVVHMVCFNSSDQRLPADYLLSSLRICTPWKQMVCWRTSLLQCAVGLNALYKNFCCKMKKGCYVVGAPLQKQNLDCVIGKVFLEGTHLYPESKTNNQTFDRHCIVQRIFFLNISVWVLTLQQTYRFNRFKLFCSINIRHTYNEVQQIQLGEISSVGFFSLSQSLIAYAIKIWPFLWGIR